jgi:threonine synthase
LGEGSTLLSYVEGTFFKHEYENPTGSIKDRSMAYTISFLYSQKYKEAVISSSGNAAISASFYCNLAGIKLSVFVSPKINPQKKKILYRSGCSVSVTNKPIKSAFLFAKKHLAYNLRQSKDENALIGPQTIAFELNMQNPLIDAVFIPVSSGVNLLGISMGYKKLDKKIPSLHAVQTQSVHPVASFFDKGFKAYSHSKVEGIVAKYNPLADNIIRCIQNTNGSGWVVSDEQIQKASQWLIEKNIICSLEGAAALAALWKAQEKGLIFQNPVCILTGKKY